MGGPSASQPFIRWDHVDYVEPKTHRLLHGQVISHEVEDNGKEIEFTGDGPVFSGLFSLGALNDPPRSVIIEYSNLISMRYRTTTTESPGSSHSPPPSQHCQRPRRIGLRGGERVSHYVFR